MILFKEVIQKEIFYLFIGTNIQKHELSYITRKAALGVIEQKRHKTWLCNYRKWKIEYCMYAFVFAAVQKAGFLMKRLKLCT